MNTRRERARTLGARTRLTVEGICKTKLQGKAYARDYPALTLTITLTSTLIVTLYSITVNCLVKPNRDQSRCTRCITRQKTQKLFPIIFTNPNPNLTSIPDPTPRHLQDKVQVTRGLDNNAPRGTVQLMLTLLRNKTLQRTSKKWIFARDN